MSDPMGTLQTPEANLLDFTRQQAKAEIIRYLNGLTTNALQRYPQAEVESWPYQKADAENFLGKGGQATLLDAPFIVGVCEFHYGQADEATRLAQVAVKAQAIKANADNWAIAAQFVNGMRARTEDTIDDAETAVEISTAILDARSAIEAFRQAAGL